MLPEQDVHPATRQSIRDLIRCNFATRDELYAAAEALTDDDLAEICRHLADGLGANVADLQQLLLATGEEALEPQAHDDILRELQEVVIQKIGERHGPQDVLGEATASEQELKKVYDAAIKSTPDTDVEGLLRRQREGVEFGETVLKKVQP